jgi:hypothetical protein
VPAARAWPPGDQILSRLLAVISAVAVALASGAAEARITRIENPKDGTSFRGGIFVAVGAYERLTGEAYGEIDPQLPATKAAFSSQFNADVPPNLAEINSLANPGDGLPQRQGTQ